MASVPSVLSILLCDSIIIEQGTKKKTLVGVFDSIWAHQFPAQRIVGFYARLTDLTGSYKFAVRVVHLSEGTKEDLIAGIEIPEQAIADPLAKVDLALNMPPILFPAVGRYEFQLFANDIYLGRATAQVAQRTG